MSSARADEGRRVLRNAVSIGAFLMSPLNLMLMVRALGTDGYGRWWWTFPLLEAAGIIGMLGADLFVRREVSRLPRDASGDGELVAVVGTGLAVAAVTGIAFAILQIALAERLAALQHDPALAQFLIILAVQPLLWNLGGVLGAALQSRDLLGALAVVRGLVLPLVLLAVYFVAWHWEFSTRATLGLMLAATVVGLLVTAALYAVYFPLWRTLACALRPTRVRPALRYGMGLFLPLVLFTLGGKVDLYVLGAYVSPAEVGVYGACLQMASSVPNVRALFDPIVQTQIGALHARDNAALGVSLRRLARLCAFGMAPAFVVTVAVGEPILGWLIGHRDASAAVPLTILTVGNQLGSVAVAAWLVSMLFAGRALSLIALGAGLAKLALLLVLVPRLGATGAAIATAVGFMLAWWAQALFGTRRIGERSRLASVVPILVVTIAVAAAGRALFVVLAARTAELWAVGIAGTAALAALAVCLLWLLDASDRVALRELVGWRRAAA
jgi:O-antigen/teichoic acid export membrane protein